MKPNFMEKYNIDIPSVLETAIIFETGKTKILHDAFLRRSDNVEKFFKSGTSYYRIRKWADRMTVYAIKYGPLESNIAGLQPEFVYKDGVFMGKDGDK